MKLKSLDNMFADLRLSMGIAKDFVADFNSGHTWEGLNAEDWEMLNTVGIEAELSEVEPGADGTLEWRGHKVVLHIYEVRSTHSYQVSLPRFHVADCKTLQGMRLGGRIERYIVSRKTTGLFNVRMSGKVTEEHLPVCKNCLTELDYKNYFSGNSRDKNKIAEEFHIVDFYSQYDSRFLKVPVFTDETARPDDWREISAKIRYRVGWCCEECGVDLKKARQYLHVHHRNTVRADNSPSNLVALCISCHSFQPNHQHLRKHRDYLPFLRKYNPAARK